MSRKRMRKEDEEREDEEAEQKEDEEKEAEEDEDREDEEAEQKEDEEKEAEEKENEEDEEKSLDVEWVVCPHTPGLEATPLPAHGGSCPHRIVETGQSQHAGDDRHTTTFI